ncbi:MAG: hypothetical protein JNJ78_18920 [Anaerolineae bacterium]|nr:hypothetical protein [Anaerolineae bacterium]
MIACIRIPYFAAVIARRSDPELRKQPLIVTHIQRKREEVYAACHVAESCGVRPKMRLSQAVALCPEAQHIIAVPSVYRHALNDLMASLSGFSQWLDVERNRGHLVRLYVDLGKLTAHAGQTIAEAILQTVQNSGFTASIGLASGKFVACAAAQAIPVGRVHLVPRGEEAAFLQALPVTWLPISLDAARRLDLFGLRRIGQLAAVPRSALIAQFGDEGGRLHRLACGEDARQVAKYQPPLIECVLKQFEVGLEDRLIVDHVLAQMATELTARLGEQGLSYREVRIIARLNDRSETERSLKPNHATHNRIALFRDLQYLFRKLEIRNGIVEIEVQISKLEAVVPQQLSLFDAIPARDPRTLLLQLSDQYGGDCFFVIAENTQQTPIPEMEFHLTSLEVA